MILFKDDFKLHTRAIIDIDTPNKSFLRYSLLLKALYPILNETFTTQLCSNKSRSAINL